MRPGGGDVDGTTLLDGVVLLTASPTPLPPPLMPPAAPTLPLHSASAAATHHHIEFSSSLLRKAADAGSSSKQERAEKGEQNMQCFYEEPNAHRRDARSPAPKLRPTGCLCTSPIEGGRETCCGNDAVCQRGVESHLLAAPFLRRRRQRCASFQDLPKTASRPRPRACDAEEALPTALPRPVSDAANRAAGRQRRRAGARACRKGRRRHRGAL